MSAANTINNLLDFSGLQIHTAFPARIISISGNTATVQPLFNTNGTMTAPIAGVPLPQSVLKPSPQSETVEDDEVEWTEYVPPDPGDIVYCVCAEKPLGSTWRGSAENNPGGLHHRMGDAGIVAVF